MTAPQPLRAGIVQWQMTATRDPDALLARATACVDALTAAGARLVLFPEFFTVPLLAGMSGNAPADMRALADLTPRIVAALAAQAQRHGLWIVAGSLPERDGERLLNVARVLAPDGRQFAQPKLHATPGERTTWGIEGGDTLLTVDTPFGRLGVLVCYDIEFPEPARVLAARGVDILCVPSWTDDRAGYLRVRYCAQARAIENECYVLLSGSTGFLAGIPGVDDQYTQAAAFTPSDTMFPPDAIAAQAAANVEQLLCVDLDIALLATLRARGTVTNGRDRRGDLYGVNWKGR